MLLSATRSSYVLVAIEKPLILEDSGIDVTVVKPTSPLTTTTSLFSDLPLTCELLRMFVPWEACSLLKEVLECCTNSVSHILHRLAMY
jgi:hypothetical protein